MSEVLTLEAVGKTYHDGDRAAVVVLDGANLSLRQGEVVALVAPSGAGKSTLLHIAGLLDTPTAGAVRVLGQDTAGLDDAGRTRLRRDAVGFVYQFHHLLPEFTALENVTLPQRAAGVRRAVARVARKGCWRASASGIAPGTGRRNCRAANSSGWPSPGRWPMRPRLLLADEPTGNLDPETSDKVFGVLMGLVRETGLAALIATHNVDLARRMDRVLRLRDGHVTGG